MRTANILLAGLLGVVVLAASGPVLAERPSAARLLPERTLVLVRVADLPDMVERLKQTGGGRMVAEPQVQAIVGQLYGSAREQLAGVEDEIGASLTDLASIPQGEIAVAMVPHEDRRPDIVLLLDVGENRPLVSKLIERGEQALAESGAARSEETIEGTKVVIYEPPRGRRRVAYFQKDGTLAVTSSVEMAKELLELWKSDDGPRLVENPGYTAIMNRSGGASDEPPQLTFYVDPISIVKAVAGDNTSARLGLAVLPALGLDGLRGVGGSLTFATEHFDQVTHLHLLLDNPRSGVVELLALESGDTTPEPWVPDSISDYTTLHWDLQKTHDKLKLLLDSFQGEGAFDRQVTARLKESTDLDLEEDLIAACDGRITIAAWFEKPARLASRGFVVAAKLKDADAFEDTLAKIAKSLGDGGMEKTSYSGVTYYIRPERAEDDGARAGNRPCVGILDGYLFATDRESFVHKMIATKQGSGARLADALDYKLIATKIARQAGGRKPGLISFNRPEEGMRQIYDLATSEETRGQLAEAAENNPVFQALHTALQNNELPPFSALAKFLAPGGAMLTDDETGFHYTGFTLRRE